MNAMKARIWLGSLLTLLCVVTPTAAQESAHQPIAVDPTTVEFAPVPNGIPCATASAVEGDPALGPAVLMFKFTSGCKVPWHWHTPNERVTFVSGAGQFEMKGGKPLQLRPGAYVFLPSRHVHRMTCLSECVLFAAADGIFDIHWVDETGKEISVEEALKDPR